VGTQISACRNQTTVSVAAPNQEAIHKGGARRSSLFVIFAIDAQSIPIERPSTIENRSRRVSTRIEIAHRSISEGMTNPQSRHPCI